MFGSKTDVETLKPVFDAAMKAVHSPSRQGRVHPAGPEVGEISKPLLIFPEKKYHNIIKRPCRADKQSDAANDISYDISMIL